MARATRLKSRIVARLSAKPLPHRVLAEMMHLSGVTRPVRVLALALTRVELECRQSIWRVLEYAYVLLGAPQYSTVSLGPAQIRWSHLLSAHDTVCGCTVRARPLLMCHLLSSRVYARCVVHHVDLLYRTLGDPRAIANAYTKGVAGQDIATPTMHSEVTLDLCRIYETHLDHDRVP